MLAIGELTMNSFLHNYMLPCEKADPFSAGDKMTLNFATRLIDEKGEWIDQTNLKIPLQIFPHS